MPPKMQVPEVHSFDAIVRRAKAKASADEPRAALVGPAQSDVIRALGKALSGGMIKPVIIGNKASLRKNAEELGIDLDRVNFVDVSEPREAVRTAAHMAEAGEIDLIIQGQTPAAEMLPLLFAKDLNFRPPGKTVSYVAVLKPEKYAKLLMLTDGAVVIQPDLKTKLDLIRNLVFVSERIGIVKPRIAVVGAVEVIYPQMPVTMEAAVLSKMAERGQIKGAHVDGPLSFDVAVDMFAAHTKGITDSPVAGQADAVVAPVIGVANGIYNAMSLYGNCELGGVVVGGRVPVALNSCADSQKARFNSIALAVLTR